MVVIRGHRFSLIFSCLAAGMACGGSSPGQHALDASVDAAVGDVGGTPIQDADTGFSHPDGAAVRVVDDVPVDPLDARANLYLPGMRKLGQNGLVRVALMRADPPPPFKGDSAWTLLVTDAAGVVLPEAVLTVVPRMPDHGHGTRVQAVVTPGDAPGWFNASPVNLFMAGYWLVSINVTLPGGMTDVVRFGFTIANA